ncbi:hypothetical protein [Methylobacterium sp. JK268]
MAPALTLLAFWLAIDAAFLAVVADRPWIGRASARIAGTASGGFLAVAVILFAAGRLA